LPELAAFARWEKEKGGIYVIEPLQKHLREVSIHTYPLVARKSTPLQYLGVLSGVFHDAGKAIDAYQRCLLRAQDGTCSYVGHEAFSALMTATLVNSDFVPSLVLADLASQLQCDEKEAWRAAKKILVLSVLKHHQAMGEWWDRLQQFLDKLRIKGVKSVGIVTDVVSVIEAALSEVSETLGMELSGALDRNRLKEAEEVIQKAVRARSPEPIAEALQAKIGVDPENDRKILLLSKYLTGCIIASDIFIAGLSRGGEKLIQQYLCKMYEFYYHLRECSPSR